MPLFINRDQIFAHQVHLLEHKLRVSFFYFNTTDYLRASGLSLHFFAGLSLVVNYISLPNFVVV